MTEAPDSANLTQCARCGMLTAGVKEFHPYAACLMFKACGNGKTVRANLLPVITYGMRAYSVGVGVDAAYQDTVVVRKLVEEKKKRGSERLI